MTTPWGRMVAVRVTTTIRLRAISGEFSELHDQNSEFDAFGPRQGYAVTSIHSASAPDPEQVTGRHVANSLPKRSSEASYDDATAARSDTVTAVGHGAGRPPP